MAVEIINEALASSTVHPSGADLPPLPRATVEATSTESDIPRIPRVSQFDVHRLELERLGKDVEKEMEGIGHTYQPHRTAFLPSSRSRMQMVPWVNFDIDHQVYQPIFETTELVTVEDDNGKPLYEFEYTIPEGIYSYWAPLRDWKMHNTPEGFSIARENINNVPDKEYKFLADTYIHLIMPLQPPEDQQMLAEIGQEAFEEDFGFRSNGAWVAETGISSPTVLALHRAGVKFIVLRDSQITDATHNPMYVPVINEEGQQVVDEEGNTIDMAVVHFNSGLSGAVSFEDQYTRDPDWFLDDQEHWAEGDVTFGSDTELNGHHKAGRDKWRREVTRPDKLAKYGFGVFDIKARLEDPEHHMTSLVENSSWSCDHELGRWTGEHNCNCGDPSHEVMGLKSELYNTLTDYGVAINTALDDIDPVWRDKFKTFFLGVRKSWFIEGDPEEDIDRMIGEDRGGLSALANPRNGNMRQLFEAKMLEFVGKTSCGWFFADGNSPERELPSSMIHEIEQLVPEVVLPHAVSKDGTEQVVYRAA